MHMRFQKFVHAGLTFALIAVPVSSQTILSAKTGISLIVRQNRAGSTSESTRIAVARVLPKSLQIFKEEKWKLLQFQRII
jgi:hypothetical protein